MLDVTGAAGDQLSVMPIHLGKGGVTEGVEAMLKESARHFPVTVYTSSGEAEKLSSDISPSGLAGPLPLLPSRRDQGVWCWEASADSSQAPEDQEGHEDLRAGSPEPMGGRLSPRGCSRQALSEHEPGESTGTHASPRPHIRRAHWHSFWIGKKDQPDARSVTLKWLPPIPVNVTGVDDLTTTVRDVGDPD